MVVLLVGLRLGWRTAPVVVGAALMTGLAAGLPLWSDKGREGLVAILGRAFVDNRMLTLFLLTLPTIGMAERYGLQRRAEEWIRSLAAATPGRLLWLYHLFRVSHGLLGVRLNGHPTFVRPLVAPMACANLPEERREPFRAAAAASENYGNFYGQNLSVIQGGILLVYGVLRGLGYEVNVWRLVLFGVPPVLFSLALSALQFRWLDRSLDQRERP